MHPRTQKKRKSFFGIFEKMINKKVLSIAFLGMTSFLVYFTLFSGEKNSDKRDQEEVLGIQSFANGDFEKSVEHLENSGEKENPDTLLKLAVSYYNEKNYEKAQENYKKAIKVDPDNFTAYNGLGNLYRDENNNDKAEEYYRKALELNETYVLAYSNLAIMFIDNGQLDEARNIIEKGLQKIPDSTTLKNVQGFAVEK